mgnify:CR=1 FL=1
MCFFTTIKKVLPIASAIIASCSQLSTTDIVNS